MDRFRGASSRARDHHLGQSVGSRRVRAQTVGVAQRRCEAHGLPRSMGGLGLRSAVCTVFLLIGRIVGT